MRSNYVKTESFLCGLLGKEITVKYEVDDYGEHPFNAGIDIIKIDGLPDDEEYSIKDVRENIEEQIRMQHWKKSFFDKEDRGCGHDLNEYRDNQ